MGKLASTINYGSVKSIVVIVVVVVVVFVVVLGVRHLLGALDRLEPSLKNREKDLQFLRGLLHSSDFNVLMKVREGVK